jgi:hypothetical protein
MKTLHSNDIRLDEPETPLHKMVDQHIDVIYRPREEKEENVKYKEEKKKAEKGDSLFDITENNRDSSEDSRDGSSNRPNEESSSDTLEETINE